MEKPFPHMTCGVCSKPYNDPRILSCLHSFCLQCLHHEIEKSGSQQMFQCPTCEQNTSIPVGGASVLPQNLHLGFEVEVAGYMSKIVSNSEVCCDECVDGRNGLAVVFCCMCRQFLCKHGRDHHSSSRKLSMHKIVGLDQEGARQLHTTMKPRDHYCSQPNHEDNKLNFCCETCSLLVCPHCTILSHKSHSVIEISTVAKTHLMEISGALEDAKEVVTKLTGAIDENNRMIEQVEISKQTALLAINQAFEILQQTLEERKKTLLSELEAISLSKTTALTLQKEQFEKMVGDIGHYTDMASQILQTHTDHEIVALGGLIPTELQATLKRVQTISLTPNQHSNISVSVKADDLIRQLFKLGNILSFSIFKHMDVHISSQEVKGEMRSKTHNGAVVYAEVEDHRDGTYTITLTPQTAGPHQLLITMDGQHVQNSPNDLDAVGLLAICLVAFAGFLHCNELIKLKCSDITFNAEDMVINVQSNRTSHGMLFRAIVLTKEGESLRNAGGLSYSRLRELLLDKIAKLGFDPALFGMHSLPAGGAIAAANAGVQDTLFKRHGCWKSESAKDGYGKDSAQRWLEFSKDLGI
ncbi:hypothetical protein EMCRGX_G013179 [Ephydatia muelleri]